MSCKAKCTCSSTILRQQENLSGRESDSIDKSGAFIWVAQKMRRLLRSRYLQIRVPAKVIYVDILDNDREGALPSQRFCVKRLGL